MRIRTAVVTSVAVAALVGSSSDLLAQLSPLSVRGKWSGGITMVDHTDGPYCEWSGTIAIEFQQTGATITGKVNTEFAEARRLRDVNLPCNPYPPRQDDLNGTVSGSRIDFTIRSATYTGSVTGDLMKGSFTAGALNRGGVRGCFQLTRAGAVARCAPQSP
ncbi:MAG: hypothetical protein HY560_11530 [Gemmatimonadetes bacterium]|nr:hypothetical protein [Gemmatimonadota bacterium]